MNFSALNSVVATLFCIMAVGFLCRKLGIIDDIASKKLSKLILSVGQPAMIINALSKADYSSENLKTAGIMVVAGFVFHLVMFLLARGAALPLKKVPDEQKITELSLIFANSAFIGFPIFEALLGPQGLFLASFLTISFNVLFWTLGLGIFARGRDDIKITIKKVLLNFGTVPCVIGFIVYLLKHPAIGFEMPKFLGDSLQYLNNLCTPISVLIIGSLIATQSVKKIVCSWKIYYVNLMRLIALPIVIALICKICHVPELYAIFFSASAALPIASSVTMLSETYNLDAGYSSLCVGTTSLTSVLTLPLMMTVVQWIFSI